MEKYVVFFDLDDTIFNVHSGRILIEEAHKRGFISTRRFFLAYIFSALYSIGILNADFIMKQLALWLKGISERVFAEFAGEIFDRYLKISIRPEAQNEIRQHKRNNAHMVILSAATPYICIPAKEYLALNDILCSKMEVIDGKFSGKPNGSYCYGEEKLRQVRKYCNKHNFDIKKTFYYADSFSDILVLESVGNPICVTPDKKLKKAAYKNGWPIYHW